MKKFFLLLFLFSNVLLYSQPFGGGDGSESYPYLIWTTLHWQEFSDLLDNDKYLPYNSKWHIYKNFKLMQNIDAELIIIETFLGHFHGNGKTIKINNKWPAIGSLGYSVYSISINDLIVYGYINAEVIDIPPHGTMSVASGVAGTVETNLGIIINCINNTILNVPYATQSRAGGIVSTNSGTISHCINNGSITGADRMSGIAGDNSGTITNCINTGKITATNSGGNGISSGVGGIVGTVANGCVGISNSINLGNIEGQGFVGGVVGLVRGMYNANTSITNCLNAGYVKGINAVGGILGNLFVEPVNISNCINTGVVEGEQDVGSIVGKE